MNPPAKTRKPRKPRQSRLASLDAMSVLEVGHDSGGDAASTVELRPASGLTATGRQSRARGATPRELADLLAKLLGGGSVLLAMWVEVEEAALEPAEANAIAEPLSRILNRQAWGKALAKRIVGADDYLALSLALFSYGVRIAPLVAAKLNRGAKDAKPLDRPFGETASLRATKPAKPEPASNGHDAGYSTLSDGTGIRFDPGMADGLSAF